MNQPATLQLLFHSYNNLKRWKGKLKLANGFSALSLLGGDLACLRRETQTILHHKFKLIAKIYIRLSSTPMLQLATVSCILNWFKYQKTSEQLTANLLWLQTRGKAVNREREGLIQCKIPK